MTGLQRLGVVAIAVAGSAGLAALTADSFGLSFGWTFLLLLAPPSPAFFALFAAVPDGPKEPPSGPT